MDVQKQLSAWIAENSTQARFARDANCSEATISRILKGDRTPSLRLAKRISQATGGAVPIDALVDESEPAQ
jgi:transcriptional regulator with XRE-family HTH domain